MSQSLGKFGLITFIVGILALLAWGEYERAWMLTTALLSSGCGLIAGALEVVLAQRGQPLEGIGRWQAGLGIALYPWAFVALILGLGFLVSGTIRLLGLSPSFSAYLARHPGPALVTGSLLLASAGIAMLIDPSRSQRSLLDILAQLPARLFGLVLITAGLAALLLGAFEWISPSGFDLWLDNVLGPFNPLQ